MATMVPKTIVDAKGDLIAATAADTVSRLAVGADNTILTADSTAATGVKWAAPAGGGKVLQVVSMGSSSTQTTTGTTLIDTTLTLNITPTLATSKVLVLVSTKYQIPGTNQFVNLVLFRGATNLTSQGYAGIDNNSNDNVGRWSTNYLDSPATTSATTYKLQFASDTGGSVSTGGDGACRLTLMEIGA
jgi:hypothetical protein